MSIENNVLSKEEHNAFFLDYERNLLSTKKTGIDGEQLTAVFFSWSGR